MIGTHEQECMCFIKEKDIIIVAKENALTVKHLDIKLNIFIKDLTTLKKSYRNITRIYQMTSTTL